MTRTPEATEIRTFATTGFEFRAVPEGRTMIGLVAPYGVPADVGTFTETLNPGCFAKSIKEAARNLPLHMNHRHEEIPVGKAVRWEEAPQGLLAEFMFDTRSDATEAARLAEEGLLASLSVGFLPLPNGSDWNLTGDRPHVTRREARMLEVSLCSVPIYADAGVIAMRSAGVPERPSTRVVPTPKKDEFTKWLQELQTK